MPVISTGTGAEVYADRLAEGLRARGHEVVVEKVPHRYQYAPWLAGLRAPKDADVTFANSWSAVAFSVGPPLVTVVHHVVHDPALNAQKSFAQRVFHSVFVRPMERAAIRRSRRVLAISQTTADAIRKWLSPAPIEVVLNGIDTDFFVPVEGATSTIGARPLKLLFVGKRSRRKGFDIVKKIVTGLGDRAELTLIGDGEEPGMEVPGAVHLGRVDPEGLRSAYQNSDFLLFPSRLEGFGLVAAEAMACGLPVLCLADGAVEEVVAPPKGGLAAPLAQATTLGDMALEVAADPGRYAQMCQSARARAAEALGVARWVDGVEAVPQDAIDTPEG